MPNKGRNLLLSGLVALSAMFGYAIAAGLVQVGSGHSMAGLVGQVVLSQFLSWCIYHSQFLHELLGSGLVDTSKESRIVVL